MLHSTANFGQMRVKVPGGADTLGYFAVTHSAISTLGEEGISPGALTTASYFGQSVFSRHQDGCVWYYLGRRGTHTQS